jgi:hypothetical protein
MTLHLPLRELSDRIVASDPGLSRLRSAAGAAGSMLTSLAVEYGLATLVGAEGVEVILFLLMGGIVAMMGSMALSGLAPGVWVRVRTAFFFPVAFGLGAAGGMALHDVQGLVKVVFVVITFLAVFVRRFGMPFFFYGFMGWIGYLFASLLGASFALLPVILLALAVGAAWVLLLSVTLLRPNTTRTVAQTLKAFHARVRTLIAVCADLADVRVGDRRPLQRWRRRVERHQRRLSEAALMIEAASGEQQALPHAGAGRQLRDYALEAQLACDALAGGCLMVAETSPQHAGQAAAVAARLYDGDLPGARRAADTLRRTLARQAADADETDRWPAYRTGQAVEEFAAAADRAAGLSLPGLPAGSEAQTRTGGRGRGDPADASGEAFEPAVGLMMGNLPGSVSLARDVAPRGPTWLLARLSMTTRQALQVAVAAGLAILAGDTLSTHRYYWALIAVFVTFTGTATRAESTRKAIYRLLGTVCGLVVAMLLAHATAGHTFSILAVIVGSLFCGFYLMRISYAYMIFFITIMIGQLYTVLGEYSNELLVLRL